MAQRDTRRSGGRELRRIAFVTGTRAEFGLMESTLREIEAHPRLRLDVIATGIHLLPRFGRTVREIESSGHRLAARVSMQRGDGSLLDQAAGLARGIDGIARTLERLRTDIVLVVGDRIEALAGALAAVTTGRWVAHVHGGDLAAGDFDDAIRNAITKLAHLHFAATRRSARRIQRMGEERRRIFCVGAPAMDELLAMLRRARGGRLRGRRGSLPRTALIVQHAYGRPEQQEERVARELLRAVCAAGLQPWILYPNTDRGHRGVIRAIESFVGSRAGAGARVDRSLPRAEFLRALLSADLLIGNSSSGIIEAPMAGTPSVNIGMRQHGRERGGSTVIDAEETYASIRSAIAKALSLRRLPGRVYGDGKAGPRIARILGRAGIDAAFLRKRATF